MRPARSDEQHEQQQQQQHRSLRRGNEAAAARSGLEGKTVEPKGELAVVGSGSISAFSQPSQRRSWARTGDLAGRARLYAEQQAAY